MARRETEEIGRLFHALGDPTRRAMLDRLGERPHSVSQLAGPLGITVSAVTQHLEVLEECGLVRTEKAGRVRTCQLAPRGLDPLEKWIREHRSHWDRLLDRLGEFLEAES